MHPIRFLTVIKKSENKQKNIQNCVQNRSSSHDKKSCIPSFQPGLIFIILVGKKIKFSPLLTYFRLEFKIYEEYNFKNSSNIRTKYKVKQQHLLQADVPVAYIHIYRKYELYKSVSVTLFIQNQSGPLDPGLSHFIILRYSQGLENHFT